MQSIYGKKKIKWEYGFIRFKNNKLNYKCKECGGRYFKSINESIKNFPILHQFCNGDLNKIVLLLRKGVYPYEYMDSWERFNETSLPDKKAFYNELNLEIWNKKPWWVSWLVCSVWYIIAWRYIWKL